MHRQARRRQGERLILRVLALVLALGPPAGAATMITQTSPSSSSTVDYSAAWDTVDSEVGLNELWGSLNPYLDADPVAITRPSDGRVYLFWGAWDGIDRDIVYATKPAGGLWSGPAPVATDNLWEDDSPSVAIDAAGRLNVAWTRVTDQGAIVLYAARIGGLWTPPSRLSPAEDSRRPRISIDNGVTLVTFRTPTERITSEVVVYVGAGVSDDIDPTRVESTVIWHEVVVR
jgi:hypothetical protein